MLGPEPSQPNVCPQWLGMVLGERGRNQEVSGHLPGRGILFGVCAPRRLLGRGRPLHTVTQLVQTGLVRLLAASMLTARNSGCLIGQFQ